MIILVWRMLSIADIYHYHTHIFLFHLLVMYSTLMEFRVRLLAMKEGQLWLSKKKTRKNKYVDRPCAGNYAAIHCDAAAARP
jgi:hypothetical protein